MHETSLGILVFGTPDAWSLLPICGIIMQARQLSLALRLKISFTTLRLPQVNVAWLRETGVVKQLLRTNLHQKQYVDQVQKVLQSLTKEGGLQEEHLELLWNLTEKVQPAARGCGELSPRVFWFIPLGLTETLAALSGLYSGYTRGLTGMLQLHAGSSARPCCRAKWCCKSMELHRGMCLEGQASGSSPGGRRVHF